MDRADVITTQAELYLHRHSWGEGEHDTLYLVRDGLVTRVWRDGVSLTTELSPEVVAAYCHKLDAWPDGFEVPSNYADL